jgi:NAD(P)-dependent dehydrogenase (short-subunit alcohol dehydrogenase family)
MNIKNKVILVTGSAGRVGKIIATKLAQKGANIVIHYNRSKEKAEETEREIKKYGINSLIVQGNLSKKEDWLKIKEAILVTFKKIDVLINNAAIFYRTPFFKVSEADWDNFMNVNLKSIFWGSQIMGQIMYENGFGKIINISDVSSETIWPNYIPYCVSKAGVVSITKGLAKALAPKVLVNCIEPGTVLLADNYDQEEENNLINRTPLKKIGSPEDIANTVLFLIEGSDFITGSIIKVDGGRSLT